MIDGEVSDGGSKVDLIQELAEAPSGLGYIHRMLGIARRAWHLDDLVLVVEDGRIGRQVFRAGRRPVTGGWSAEVALGADPGLHRRPDLGSSTPLQRQLARLCQVALQMDVRSSGAQVDLATGLLDRGGLEDALAAAVARERRQGRPVGLAIVDLTDQDLDRDAARGAAAGFRANLRAEDHAAQVGPRTLAAVLSGSGPPGAARATERIDLALREVTRVGTAAHWGSATYPEDADSPEGLWRIAVERLDTVPTWDMPTADRTEMALRARPGVLCVGTDDAGGTQLTIVTVADGWAAASLRADPSTVRSVDELAIVPLDDVEHTVLVRRLERVPGVSSVSADRDDDGHLERLLVAIDDLGAVRSARGLVEDELGTEFGATHVTFHVIPRYR